MLKFLACILAFGLTSTASAVCQWTSEQRDDYFRKDPTYMDPPVIQRQACKPDLAPVCSGFAYCPQPGIPRRSTSVACKAVKVNDKYRCPSAQACYDDPDIEMFEASEIPGPARPPAAESEAPARTEN